MDPPPPAHTERAFEQLLNAVPDAVFVTSGDGRIMFANQQAEIVFGYTRDELLDQPVEMLIPERLRPRHVPQRLAYAESPAVRPMGQGLELLGLRKDGQEFPVEISLSPAAWQGLAVVVSTVRDVTERKAAEAAIRAAEERFQRFVEGVKDYAMFLLDTEGHVATWNPGAERLKGYRPEEIVGQHFSRFYPQEAIAEGRPERALRVAEREGRWEDEGWRVRKDGSRFWANVIITALYDGEGQLQGFAKIARDTTERRRSDLEREQALAREQAARGEAEAGRQRLERLTRAFQGFAAAGVDNQLVLAAVARAASDAVGDGCGLRLVSADTLRLDLTSVFHPDPNVLAFMRELTPQTKRADGSFEGMVLQTGQPMLIPVVSQADLRALVQPENERDLERVTIYSMLVVPLRTHVERIGTLALWRDTPGHPYTADDLALIRELADRAALTIENARLYETAQAALHTRDEFMGAIGHDLGQPLTVVNGALQLLQRFLARGTVPTGEELREEVDAIAASVASMMAMVIELLDVAHAQSGRPLELSYRPLDLVALVQQGVRMQQQTSELHRIVMDTAAASVPLEGDRDRLTRVVSNLLSNAIKYSPDGGTINVSLAPEESDHRRWMVLSVKDEGLGIPAAELPEIFERFHRASNVRARIAGTGIGLAGAKQTVELHGGDIQVESVEGEGTTVTVRLPLD